MAEALRTQTTRNETGIAFPTSLQVEAAGNTYDATDPKHRAYGRPDGYYRVWPDTEVTKTMHTTASKGVAFPPFIAELRGGSSDARPASEPLATVTASGSHHALVTSKIPRIEDCSFRMLSPQEISRAMAFPAEYQMLGTKRDQVRLAGNAVTPPAARDLVAACAESLGVAA